MDQATQSSPTIAIERGFNLATPPANNSDHIPRGTNIKMSEDGSPCKPITTEEPEGTEAEFFDLHPPTSLASRIKIEDIAKRLFSAEHLHFILGDHALFSKFSSFLNSYKPSLIPTLIRYLEMRKAMKATEYANAIASSIRWPSHTDHCKFMRMQAATTNVGFEDYAAGELNLLCSEALPAFITNMLVNVVTDCVSRDITGQGIPVMRDLVRNLGEVYCLTDPSVHDNPIIFASEEFHKTTQYGTTYVMGRNCRFLQGPGTDKDTTLRLARAVSLGQESNELILNYRRDGSPFMNLLMVSPLLDDKGAIRYFIGALVDVTGLVIDGHGIESFRALLQSDETKRAEANGERGRTIRSKFSSHPMAKKSRDVLSKLQELSMMLSQDESDVAVKNSRGGSGTDDSTDSGSAGSGDSRSSLPPIVKNRGQSKRVIGGGDVSYGLGHLHLNAAFTNGKNTNPPGLYKHYLVVRPYPTLQIIFVSRSLRIPGLLRSNLFTKIGGPTQTITALESAFRDGASVTAKVLWLPKNTLAGERGHGAAEVKPRFIRCTPLLGSDDRVGAWMILLVRADGETGHEGYAYDRRGSDGMGERKVTRVVSMNNMRTGLMRRAHSLDIDADGGFGLRKSSSVRK